MTSRQDPDHHIRNLKFDFEATKIVAFEDPESEMKEYYWLAPHPLNQLKHHRRNYFGGIIIMISGTMYTITTITSISVIFLPEDELWQGVGPGEARMEPIFTFHQS